MATEAQARDERGYPESCATEALAPGAASGLDTAYFMTIEGSMDAWYPFRSEAAKQRYLAHDAERSQAWPVPVEERLVPTDYGDTFVRISGPVDGPPLIMLPGVGSPGHSLRAMAKPLAQRFRLYVLDNIYDIGRSVNSRPVRGAADFVAWLDSLFNTLKLDEVNLMGLSYGGWVCAQYALARPDRVRGLVLLAPAGTVAPLPFGFIWRAILTLVSKRFMDDFFDWAAPELATDPERADERRRWIEDAVVGQSTFASRRLVEPRPLSDEQLAQLAPPALFLVGDREVIFDASRAVERLARVAPQIRAHLIPGASHDAFITRAVDIAERTRTFLDAAPDAGDR